jgi:UDP-N-acetylmuramoyl-tripeptide--D-alanyl-D-alanine ligase
MDTQNRIVILGDMFELGNYAEEGHRKIGIFTKKMNLKQVILCGEKMRFAHVENNNSLYFKTRKKLEEYLENHKFEDSTILIKGSRAMALENLVDKL